jgi:hypothetical protein
MDCDDRQNLQQQYALAVNTLGKAVVEAARLRAHNPRAARKIVDDASAACQAALQEFTDHIAQHRCPAPQRYRRGAVASQPVQTGPAHLNLSYDAILVFVLWNGCNGRLRNGRVERSGSQLNVFSPHREKLNEYVSGSQLRSWCVMTMDGFPIGDWYSIAPEDQSRLRFPIR